MSDSAQPDLERASSHSGDPEGGDGPPDVVVDRGRLVSKLKSHAAMFARGDVVGPFRDYRRWLWSTDEASAYRIDLTSLAPRPATKFPVASEHLQAQDATEFFAAPDLPLADVRELKTRERVWKMRLPTAYVARNNDGDIVFVGFAFSGRTHGDAVREIFGEAFRPLADDEVLIENIWTHPRFRNAGVAAAAIHDMLAEAAAAGLRAGMIYIDDGNPASWLSMRKIGFERRWARRHRWRLGRVVPVWHEDDTDLPVPPRPGKAS